MNFMEAVKWTSEGKEFLVNGKETFTGTGQEFLKANFELKEDNWNLADSPVTLMYPKSADCGTGYSKEDIKTFIQKVKEDMKVVKENLEDPHYIKLTSVERIIDKRAGDLK